MIISEEMNTFFLRRNDIAGFCDIHYALKTGDTARAKYLVQKYSFYFSPFEVQKLKEFGLCTSSPNS